MATTMAAALVAQTATGGVGMSPGPYTPVSIIFFSNFTQLPSFIVSVAER